MKRVLLAMSGGTDSSVSAILLKEQGYWVEGLYMSFFDSVWADATTMYKQQQSLVQVQELCTSLGIAHHSVDVSQNFYRVVIEYFVQEYAAGRTPFPCAVCNPQVKWKVLMEYARSHAFDYIATGHYVQTEVSNGVHYVTDGIDPDKNQSFFLWGLSQEILSHTLFPLGALYKTRVREIALEHGYESVSRKKDSLGICFLADTNYRPFVERELLKRGIRVAPGVHVDEQMQVLSLNEGYCWYTVGQRRQLGYHANKRLFVKELLPLQNKVVLAEYASLYKTEMFLHSYNLPRIEDLQQTLIVKIRYRNQATPCRVHVIDANRLHVQLLEPLEAIAPGQTAVLYYKHMLVGGGFIE